MILAACLLILVQSGHRPPPKFERIVIDADFPGAYQVEVADVDGDGKPDIVALGGATCAWYQNPTWKKRLITSGKQTPGIITSATADLDGDGRAEVAIGYEFEMNEPSRGKLLLASMGKTLDDPWTLKPLADVPSIHRLRWARPDRDPRPRGLVVAPLFGARSQPPTYDQDLAHLVVLSFDREHAKAGGWTRHLIAERPVLHAIEVDGSLVRTADNLGVGLYPIFDAAPPAAAPILAGARGPAPRRGCSEVHVGKLAGRGFVATIDPWHGSEVAVSTLDPEPRRTVLDDTLDLGHALWVADVDGDGDDEIFAGHRGKGHRVSIYDYNGKSWDRTILDEAIAAQDLRGGDLDGDGVPDVVAVGGSTHNVIWYRPIRVK